MRRMFQSLTTIVAVLGDDGGRSARSSVGGGRARITVAQGIDAEFLDVQMTNNIVTLIINTSIYDTLLHARQAAASSFPRWRPSHKLVSEKVWEVKLRQGVTFHNGEPFDANAVKFSFERIYRADFKSPQKGWFSTVERGGDRRSLHGALPHQGA